MSPPDMIEVISHRLSPRITDNLEKSLRMLLIELESIKHYFKDRNVPHTGIFLRAHAGDIRIPKPRLSALKSEVASHDQWQTVSSKKNHG